MNNLAKYVNDFISRQGVKKVWIADKLGISQQLLNKRLNKDNFTVDDANTILAVMGYKIRYEIVTENLSNKTTTVYPDPAEDNGIL